MMKWITDVPPNKVCLNTQCKKVIKDKVGIQHSTSYSGITGYWCKGCGKKHSGIPFPDEDQSTEVDIHGNIAKSVCPNCGTLWGYIPNDGYYCEQPGCNYPDGDKDTWHEVVSLDTISAKGGKAKTINLVSFSYKHGVPGDIVYKVIDVRRMVRNPWKDATLRTLNGLHPDVQAFVMNCKGGQKVIKRIESFWLYPVHVAVGCMGGRHRSVAIVELAAESFRKKGWEVTVTHRDLKVKGGG